MLTKSMIAIVALLASFTVLPVGNAEAKSHVNFNVGIGIGVGGFNPGYGYGGAFVPGSFDEPSYGVSCGQARSIVNGNGFYNVTAIDCSAPNYRFIAWQSGNRYKVRINSAGNITGVTPL